MTDDTEEKKELELDPETKKELEKAPQVNERPGPLNLPNSKPEKLIPIHLIKIKNENTIFKNSKKSEISEKSEKEKKDKSQARLKILIQELTSPGIEGRLFDIYFSLV